MVNLEVIAVTEEGKEAQIRATISAPQRGKDGRWVCKVKIKPLQAKTLNVRGIDSFHAVWLACSLILKLLAHLKAGGGRLLNPDRTEFPLEAYLAGLDEKR